jgi:hypothetical protein
MKQMNLNDRKWGIFLIGDLFCVKRPPARNKDNYEIGNVPFVASGSVNNGVMKCCKPLENEKLDKAGCITVSPVDGSAFYQPYPFLGRGGAGSSVLMLYTDNINLYSGQFIAKMISNTCACKYTYGHMGNKDGIRRERIMLPIDEDNKPDYQFMEDYVKELMSKKREQYLDYCKEQLKFFGGGDNLIPLADKQWNAFFIVDIFDVVQRGKRLKTADHLAGEIPYVSSSSLNNGVDDFVSNDNGVRRFSNCLSLANSGSVGSSFYEPFEFVASDHITHLKNKGFNKYHYLFLATMTSRLSQKYNFNREINDKRIAREIIFLPITDNGTPDYTYMEKYSKNLLREKIQRYIKYIENK